MIHTHTTQSVAKAIKSRGVLIGKTTDINDLVDGSIEIAGTKLHIQVGETYLALSEDRGETFYEHVQNGTIDQIVEAIDIIGA
jgi:hypothetical protein